MRWLQILRLIVELWPIIEKMLTALDGDEQVKIKKAAMDVAKIATTD